MSRSYRKAIIKEKDKTYFRKIRRICNSYIRDIVNFSDMEDCLIPKRQEIFKDYDYCDYRFNIEYRYSNKEKSEQDNIDHVNKWRRK